jgi:acyl-ACP thioesterase
MKLETLHKESNRYTFTVQPLQLDFQGKLSVIHLCEVILDCAARDASASGFGLQDVLTSNLAWVLTRLYISIEEYGKLFDVLSIETWVDSVNTSYSIRKFNVYNGENKIIASASTSWMQINITTRRPHALDEKTYAAIIQKDKQCLTGSPIKIEPFDHAGKPYTFSVKYSDLDIQDHVNSGKYIEWLMDEFPREKYLKQTIHEMQINYLSECIYGDIISIYHKEVENGTTIIEALKSSGKPACRALFSWK